MPDPSPNPYTHVQGIPIMPFNLSSPSTPALQRKTVSVRRVPHPPRSGRKLQTAKGNKDSTRMDTSLLPHHRTLGYGTMEYPRLATTSSKTPRLANGASEATNALVVLSEAAARVNRSSGQDRERGETFSGATLLVAGVTASTGPGFGVTGATKPSSVILLGGNASLGPWMRGEGYTPLSAYLSNSNLPDRSYTDLEAGGREERTGRWMRGRGIVETLGVVVVWLEWVALLACVTCVSAVAFGYGDGGGTGNGWLGMSGGSVGLFV
ncbi:hypothetical protein BDV97DRAFT_232553 [Delphinella strobiligena]|nr:hypothetical protein BDV97DRAFT_232553 [Delphinella strobiligena]